MRRNVSLAPLTTFRVGGKANYYTKLSCPLELAEALEYAEKNHLPAVILGGGSNILFSDKGFSGFVIHIEGGGVKVSGNRIHAAAGASLSEVIEAAIKHSLSGLEKLSGIPGSFGGAVCGNAGAFGAEIGDMITCVKAMDKKTGMVQEYRKEQCHFAYRESSFKKDSDLVILSADLLLKSNADEGEMKHVVRETLKKREAKHPQKAKCAGSFFMNPIVKDKSLHEEFEKDTGVTPKDEKLPAGWLITHVGLRGRRIGGAMVSEKHPNYLLNTGHASAEDIVTLSSLIKTRVRDELGIRLQEEVQYIGF